jgi:hypothetical protein
MSRHRKITIAIISVIFMTGVCCGGFGLWGAWSVSRLFVSDPADLKALGAEIVDYTLPPGYTEVIGMHFFDSTMVAIAQENATLDDMLLMLTKPPEGAEVDQAVLEKQLAAALRQQFSMQGFNLTLDTVKTRIINDEEVALTYRKGEDNFGTPYRQMSTLFNGSKGKVFILVQGTEAGWDQAALDSFLNSIH